MAWNHPDDVPTPLTTRVYSLGGPPVSQEMYARIVADSYEAVRQEVLRDLAQTERVLTRDNTDEIALWVGGWRAGGAFELVGWGLRGSVQYARPGETIRRADDGTFGVYPKPGPR